MTHTSLPFDPGFTIELDDVVRAVFFGLGADGTVGANKTSIKIIGEHTSHHVQGYFVYDSKTAGARSVSRLRVAPRPIRSEYLIRSASFVACHHFRFLETVDVLEHAGDGAQVLLNSPYPPTEVWDRLPGVQEQIIAKKQAGADGLELNIYELATDPDEDAGHIERRALQVEP